MIYCEVCKIWYPLGLHKNHEFFSWAARDAHGYSEVYAPDYGRLALFPPYQNVAEGLLLHVWDENRIPHTFTLSRYKEVWDYLWEIWKDSPLSKRPLVELGQGDLFGKLRDGVRVWIVRLSSDEEAYAIWLMILDSLLAAPPSPDNIPEAVRRTADLFDLPKFWTLEYWSAS